MLPLPVSTFDNLNQKLQYATCHAPRCEHLSRLLWFFIVSLHYYSKVMCDFPHTNADMNV